MKRLLQTRVDELHLDEKEEIKSRDNAYATVVACFLDYEDAEDCLQIQEHFPEEGNEDDVSWMLVLSFWLSERGYDWGSMSGHLYDDSYYIVIGESFRMMPHVCIYKNGHLWHDPHPDGTGLLTEEIFEYIRPNKVIFQ
jgi:hypothetical protein